MDEPSQAQQEARTDSGERLDLIPQAHGGAMAPQITSANAAALGAIGGSKPKNYSLRVALARKLKARRADGSRPWDDALTAFVTKLLAGDVRAFELALDAVDGPQEQKKTVEHREKRSLVIKHEGPRIVEAEPSQVPAQLELPPDQPL